MKRLLLYIKKINEHRTDDKLFYENEYMNHFYIKEFLNGAINEIALFEKIKTNNRNMNQRLSEDEISHLTKDGYYNLFSLNVIDRDQGGVNEIRDIEVENNFVKWVTEKDLIEYMETVDMFK